MKKCAILVVCRHPEILATVVRLINNNPEWHATGCQSDDEAFKAFMLTKQDLVLIGAGVEAESEAKLRDEFIALNPKVKVIQHFGGGSGLLSAEIYGALS